MAAQHSLKNKIKNSYYDARIYLKFGTTSPQRVPLPNTDRTLYVDPSDPRARKKIIIKSSVRGKSSRNQSFWKTAINQFKPQTALDIGLNYGECLLSMAYPVETRLFAFEANLNLKPYIEQSLADHPNREQIECHFNLVGDKIETTDFWIDKEWSGCSSAAPPAAGSCSSKYEKKSVASVTIDHVLNLGHAQQERLFFKLDVEGYEYRVLLGMQATLADTNEVVGFVEFDPTLLRRAGEDVEEYWDFLRKHFEVYAFNRDDSLQSFQHLSLSEIEIACGEAFHTDLLLIQSSVAEEVLAQLLSGWKKPELLQKAA